MSRLPQDIRGIASSAAICSGYTAAPSAPPRSRFNKKSKAPVAFMRDLISKSRKLTPPSYLEELAATALPNAVRPLVGPVPRQRQPATGPPQMNRTGRRHCLPAASAISEEGKTQQQHSSSRGKTLVCELHVDPTSGTATPMIAFGMYRDAPGRS